MPTLAASSPIRIVGGTEPLMHVTVDRGRTFDKHVT